MAKARSKRRIMKELEKFHQEAVQDGLALEVQSDDVWLVSFTGAVGTLYEGERFTLRVRFTEDYPMDSPEVVFTSGHVPVHCHIYSNGHICLNILGEEWSPALTVRSICLSVLSMLSAATSKVRPEDDAMYSRMKGPNSNPKNTRFVYHDDTV